MGKALYCGVDIGGTKILAGLMDKTGTIIGRKKCATPQKASSTKVYQHINGLLTELFDEQEVDLNQLKGIGVGVPGIVMPNHVDILRTPNIALAKFPLAQRLSKNFSVNVVLGNDVNLGLLGEKWLGIGKDYQNIIGLFPGTGVGGGIIIDGKLVVGSQGAAGELGHMIIDQNSLKESAGLRGTLEALASRRAIERDIRQAIQEGQKTIVADLLKGKLGVIKSKVLAQSLDAKDPVVVKVVNEMCRTLANACISMRLVFNPDMIILGGGVMEACGDYILPRVRRRSNASPFLAGIDHCKIVKSQLGDDAVLFGAVALLKQELGKKHTFKSKKYPLVKILRGNRIVIDEKAIKEDFFIRADGKIKEFNGSTYFKSYVQKSMLDAKVLRKFCKRKTDVLIIAKGKRNLRLSKDAKSYLKDHAVSVKMLPLRDAIRTYTALDKRKAMFVPQNSPR